MIKKKVGFWEKSAIIMVCIIVLLPLSILIDETIKQRIIKSQSEDYTCIYGEKGPAGSCSNMALYFDKYDNYVYCKIHVLNGQLLSYPVYTEDGNKIKYINGVLIEDNTGKEVRIND